jgi:branched-chain amino acid transport system substrate-binding protein
MYLTPRILFLGLIVSIVAVDSVIYFSEIGDKRFFSELIITITAAAAAFLGLLLVFRQKIGGLFGKSWACFAIGLVLWLCADITLIISDHVFETSFSIPSIIDVFWISGYAFFAYNIFSTYKHFQNLFSRKVIFISIIGNAIFLAYIISITLSLAVLNSPTGITMYAVIISYLILNSILMVPGAIILVSLWNQKSWCIPWKWKTIGLFAIVITDSWFALIVMTGLLEHLWIPSLFFAADSLLLVAAVLWYNKFLTQYNEHDEKLTCMGKMDITLKVRKKIRPFEIPATVIIIAAIIAYSFVAPSETTSNEVIIPTDGSHVITLGALVPLSGIWSSSGVSTGAALEIAVEDVNDYFSKSGSQTRVGLIIEDTKTDPAIALEKLHDLAEKGIRIVIGPLTSAELNALKKYADENDILLVSTSTAPSLAIPGDNLFRFVPDDTHQGKAIATKMWNDGIRVVVPMWRSDLWGNDLYSSMKKNFEMLGGTVVDGISYVPHTGELSASLNRINFIVWDQELKSMNSMVSQATALHGTDKVAVILVAFDEVVPILMMAGMHPDLSSVRWYGSDGSAKNDALVRNSHSAMFSMKTGFLNPMYGIDENNERLKLLEEEIEHKTEMHPSTYAIVAYDAFWVAALTQNATLATNDFSSLKNTLVQKANSYLGVTGNTTLNDAGDRKYGNYNFWVVSEKEDHDGFHWEPVGKYQIEN